MKTKRILQTTLLAWSLCQVTSAGHPGLLLTVQSAGGGDADTRVVRTPDLHVPANSAPSALTPPGPFTATWRGALNLEARSRLYFSVEGIGDVRLTINDEVVLEQSGHFTTNATDRLRLNPGEIPVEITYQSPEKGDARLRVFWRGREFDREPIPPGIWSHASKLTPNPIREGRRLFADLNCIKCHMPDDGSINPRTCMPELMAQGPGFLNIGHRLDATWIREWIKNPKAHRTDARMPDVGLNNQDAADIAEFLGGVMAPGNPAHGIPPGDLVSAGGQLFHNLGCISCHTIKKDGLETAVYKTPPLALDHVTTKYPPGELSAFLKNPHLYYPGIRMPHFQLTQAEADSLEVFLRSEIKPMVLPDGPAGDPIRGTELVKTRGCLNCHQYSLDNQHQAPSLATIFKTDWKASGCASSKATIQFKLSPEQQSALHAFGKAGPASLTHQNLAEYSERQFNALNCAACHDRDGIESSRGALQELTKHLIPEKNENTEHDPHKQAAPPDLTYMGEKLKADWMARLFTGDLNYRSRSWLEARMPAFPSRGKQLADGFAQARGVITPPPTGIHAANAAMGEQLIGPTGFTCISCHGNGKVKPIAVFEGQGINFSYIFDRLQPDYYLRWMRHPQRIDPASIMPKYTDDEGASALTDVLDGNAEKQFGAIWDYFHTIRSNIPVE